MTENLVRKNERIDDLQNGYFLIQDPDKFCFGMDAVLLASFCRILPSDTVLDLGCGTGILPVLLCARSQCRSFTGLEIQEDCAEMARRSVLYNHLEDRITIHSGDLKEAAQRFGTASFRVVTCNPPYMAGAQGIENLSREKAIARHELLCTLEDIARETSSVLKSKGRLFMVHRPFRLSEIIQVLSRYHLEPKRLRMVHPYLKKEPNMVLIEAVKGANSGLRVEPPVIVFEKPGVFTRQIQLLYGAGGREQI